MFCPSYCTYWSGRRTFKISRSEKIEHFIILCPLPRVFYRFRQKYSKRYGLFKEWTTSSSGKWHPYRTSILGGSCVSIWTLTLSTRSSGYCKRMALVVACKQTSHSSKVAVNSSMKQATNFKGIRASISAVPKHLSHRYVTGVLPQNAMYAT